MISTDYCFEFLIRNISKQDFFYLLFIFILNHTPVKRYALAKTSRDKCMMGFCANLLLFENDGITDHSAKI